MASRDYGQRRGAPQRHARPRQDLPGWLWLMVGASLGLAAAAIVYIARPPGPAAPPSRAAATAPAQKKIELPPKEKPRFSFYEVLPSYEVVIPREKDKGGGKSADIAEPGEYVIQVGSFRGQPEAEAQKAKLALLGIESRVEKVTIDNRDTWYRVRIGPEKDLAKIHSILTRLDENNVQALLMKVTG